ncbi:hypothetical protein [Paenirhodobacter populi]|uniref:hypothetical protein n=1 Tax=Paenirhodobacter populi TaxID=2306993 RepID=UPI000FE418B9|nr:hypothetical protein [Sinirhodobacter populi]RWR04165.1 hypothetical protein D2T32_20525 [Sinirhodobacter populi]
MRALILAMAGVVAGLGCHEAQAQTVFSCGASSGYAFYPKAPLNDEDTWTQDGMSQGLIQLVLVNEQPDILLRDANGMMSSRAEGADVTVLNIRGNEGYVTVLVAYPQGAQEIYTFDSGRKKVFWTQHKFGFPIDKVAAFIADCQ